MDAILLIGCKRKIRDIHERIRDLVNGSTFLVRPTLWAKRDGPTHDGYIVEFPDKQYCDLRDIADAEKINIFPFLDHEGSTDAIVVATLQEYGMIQHKD